MKRAYERWLTRFNQKHPSLVWSDKLLRRAYEDGYRAGVRAGKRKPNKGIK